MYEFRSRVRYSETDRRGVLSMQGLLRILQDANYLYAEDAGRGISYQAGHRAAWYLLSWDVRMLRAPRLSEPYVFTAAFYARSGSLSKKYLALRSETGELLADARTRWAFVNTVTGEPVECPADYFGEEPLLSLDRKSGEIARIRPTGSGRLLSPLSVTPLLLDENQHVNNVRLSETALTLTGYEEGCTRFRAEFLRQTRGGETLTPRLTEGTDGDAVLTFLASDGEANAVFSCK